MAEGTSGAVDSISFREEIGKAALRLTSCLHGLSRASCLRPTTAWSLGKDIQALLSISLRQEVSKSKQVGITPQ